MHVHPLAPACGRATMVVPFTSHLRHHDTHPRWHNTQCCAYRTAEQLWHRLCSVGVVGFETCPPYCSSSTLTGEAASALEHHLGSSSWRLLLLLLLLLRRPTFAQSSATRLASSSPARGGRVACTATGDCSSTPLLFCNSSSAPSSSSPRTRTVSSSFSMCAAIHASFIFTIRLNETAKRWFIFVYIYLLLTLPAW